MSASGIEWAGVLWLLTSVIQYQYVVLAASRVVRARRSNLTGLMKEC